jgi:hypothetical protein
MWLLRNLELHAETRAIPAHHYRSSFSVRCFLMNIRDLSDIDRPMNNNAGPRD